MCTSKWLSRGRLYFADSFPAASRFATTLCHPAGRIVDFTRLEVASAHHLHHACHKVFATVSAELLVRCAAGDTCVAIEPRTHQYSVRPRDATSDQSAPSFAVEFACARHV